MRRSRISMLASNQEIFGWVKDLWEIGRHSKYGYRMPGTPADVEGANYVLKKFQDLGLVKTFLEPVPIPVCFPDKWVLKVKTERDTREIPCYFLRYAEHTPETGITAQMVYVGRGTRDDFAANDVRGKIAVVSWFRKAGSAPERQRGYTTREDAEPVAIYDPDSTLPKDPAFSVSPANHVSSYRLAVENGATGYIGILDYLVDGVNQYLHHFQGLPMEIPALSVGPEAGDYLRTLIAAGPAEATMILTGFTGEGVTYDVYGFLPGRTDKIIVVHTHHDGWANNDASGISVLLALAKYFSQFPKESRERTLMFIGFGSHFGKRPPWGKYDSLARTLLPKMVCTNQIEHISKEYRQEGKTLVEAGLAGQRNWTLTGPKPGAGGSVNPCLLSFVTDAVKKHGLKRSIISPRWASRGPTREYEVVTKATVFAEAGIPTIRLSGSLTPWGMTYRDTPDTVNVEALGPTAAAFVDIIQREDAIEADLLLPVGKTEG